MPTETDMTCTEVGKCSQELDNDDCHSNGPLSQGTLMADLSTAGQTMCLDSAPLTQQLLTPIKLDDKYEASDS